MMGELAISLFVTVMARWAWPGCVESARCRRQGCRECTLLVPCDVALRRIDEPIPLAIAVLDKRHSM